MKLILCFSILIASSAWADNATDRETIERLIASLNNGSKASDLFTADAPDSERRILSAHEEPLSEATPPRITIHSIRFITSEVALVECANIQYGSVIMARSTPELLVMKKERAQWRIASVRVLLDSRSLAKPLPDH